MHLLGLICVLQIKLTEEGQIYSLMQFDAHLMSKQLCSPHNYKTLEILET